MKTDKDRMAKYLWSVTRDNQHIGSSWDISIGDGLDFVTVYHSGKRVVRYGFENAGSLVIRTSYNGA